MTRSTRSILSRFFQPKISGRRKYPSRGQSSMEFVILTGFMLLSFLIFYIVIQSKLVEANRGNMDTAAKQVETLVVNELKLAESVSDGYYREFELPQNVNGLEYTVAIMPGVGNTPEIVVKYNGKERVYFVPQGYVDPNCRVGIGKNNVTKKNGYILIQNMTS